jgi:hypothetical protein
MAEMVKVLSTEIALSTANTVSNASVVRMYNNTAGAVLITRANGGGTIGTITLAAGATEYLQKAPTETFASNTAIRAAAVGIN